MDATYFKSLSNEIKSIFQDSTVLIINYDRKISSLNRSKISSYGIKDNTIKGMDNSTASALLTQQPSTSGFNTKNFN